MSTLLETMDALADQIRTTITPEIAGLQVEPRMNISPSPDPVSLDIYPADPFQEPDAFGVGENDIMLTVRARVNTPDSEGAQDALLALMDPKAATSVEQAIMADPSLGGVVGNLRIEAPPSNYGIFPDASGTAAFLGCTWTVRIIPGEGDPPVPSGFVIGSSYLFGTSVLQSGLTDAAVVDCRFTLGDSAESDIEIDGGDDTLVNILTSGWYAVFNGMEFGVSTVGPMLYAQMIATVNETLLSVPVSWGGSTDGRVTLGFVAPAIPLEAGDVLGFTVSAQTSGDVWSMGADPLALQIVRVA